MKIKIALQRVVMAAGVLAGRLDGQCDMLPAIAERQKQLDNLRAALEQAHKEKQYWFNLWMQMGREFENAQNTLIEEVDKLRRQLGQPEGKWKEILQTAFHDKFVQPASHPVPGVRSETDVIEVPPTKPAEVTDDGHAVAPENHA